MVSRASTDPLNTDNGRLDHAESDVEAGRLEKSRSAPSIDHAEPDVEAGRLEKSRSAPSITEPKTSRTFTAMGQIRATIFNSWINVLLPLVPAGFAVHHTRGPSLTTFLVNFFEIIPLSLQAEYAIAELIVRIGENWGGLAYITIRYVLHRPKRVLLIYTSNFVQIVSSILLLRSGQLDVLHQLDWWNT